MKKTKIQKKSKLKKAAVGLITFSGPFTSYEGAKLIKAFNSCSVRVRKLGIVESEDDGMKLPPYYKTPKRRPLKPQASAMIAAGTMKLIFKIFGSWIATELCKTIWAEISRFRNGKNSVEVHFDSHIDGVCLIIRIYGSNDRELQSGKKLVPQAIELAKAWVHEKGITHKYILYKIHGDQISPIPSLSNTELIEY